MKCAICDSPQTEADMRLESALRGICLECAREGDFYGFTDEEINRCQAMLKVVAANKKMTNYQRRHLKEMGE